MATFLVVDDDRELQIVYNALLLSRGHEVIGTAYDGEEAVKKYSGLKFKPDMVLMDHRMPRCDGVNATQEIMSIDPSATIIFLSADRKSKNDAIKAGAIEFLPKPIRSRKLFEIISRILRSRKYKRRPTTDISGGRLPFSKHHFRSGSISLFDTIDLFYYFPITLFEGIRLELAPQKQLVPKRVYELKIKYCKLGCDY